MAIEVTSKAAITIKRLSQEDGRSDAVLRVSVNGGGCSGMSYQLKFEETTGGMDKTFEVDGVKVVVDAKSYLYLNGMILDYSDGLNGKGFVFQNPNAKSVCGCGESFSV